MTAESHTLPASRMVDSAAMALAGIGGWLYIQGSAEAGGALLVLAGGVLLGSGVTSRD